MMFKTITDPSRNSSTGCTYAYIINPNKFENLNIQYLNLVGNGLMRSFMRHLLESNKFPYIKAVNKGSLWITEGHKDEGIDYISNWELHLQLLPIYDFEGVDELSQFSSYNWGYNPSQYNVVEGSFSTDPNNPYKRINELIELIDYIHKKGMRVSMDVVYNHVYNMKTFPFESLVPGYFFRFDRSGIKTQSSGVEMILQVKD